MESTISYPQWLLKKPLVRLLPIIGLPLLRFSQSGLLIDAVIEAIIITVATYIWYRLATSPKGNEFMNEVNKQGGWALLFLIGVSIFTNPLIAIILGVLWLIYLYRNVQTKSKETESNTK